MAKIGESWVKAVMLKSGWTNTNSKTRADSIFKKKNLIIILEEKDYKTKVYVNKLGLKTYYGKKSYLSKYNQIYKYYTKLLNDLKEFNNIILTYIVPELSHHRVETITFNKKTIFVVEKDYFPKWLNYLEKLYLGYGGIGHKIYHDGL